MRIVKICYNCGSRISWMTGRDNTEKCDVCGAELHKLDFFTGMKIGKMTMLESDKWIEQQTGRKIPEELLTKRKEQARQYLEAREKEREQEAAAYRLKMVEQSIEREQKKHPTNIHCPTCGSNKIEKISGFDRAMSAKMFGLASSKIGKTFECKSCGYKW